MSSDALIQPPSACAARWVMRLLLVVAGICVVSMPWTARSGVDASDELGYWAWQQSWLVDGDLDPTNQIRADGMIWFDGEMQRNGKSVVVNKYPTGVSQVIAPLTAITRLGLLINNHIGWTQVRTDGRSRAEVIAAMWGLGVLGMLAIGACYATARQFAPPLPAAIATTCAWAGTSAFAYTWKLPFWSHAAGLAMVSFVYYLATVQGKSRWQTHRGFHSGVHPIFLGLCAGLCVCIRPTLAIAIAPAGLWWLEQLRAGKGWSNSRTRWKPIAICLLAAAVPVTIELLTRHVVYGNAFFNGYSTNGEGFTFPPPNLWKVMFHLDPAQTAGGQGVFVAHPVTLVAVVGLVILLFRARQKAMPIGVPASMLAAVASTILLYGCWWVWNLGFGFGARWAADFMVIWAIGLAAAIENLHTKPFRAAYALVPLVMWSLYWNLSAMEAIPPSARSDPPHVGAPHNRNDRTV